MIVKEYFFNLLTSIYQFILPFTLFLFFLILPAVNAAPAEASSSVLHSSIELYKKGNKQEAEKMLVNFIQSENAQADKSMLYKSYLTLSDMYLLDADYPRQQIVLKSLADKLKIWGYKETIDNLKVDFLMAQNAINQGQELIGLNKYNKALKLAKKLYPPNSIKLIEILLPLARVHINRLESEQANDYLVDAQNLLKNNSSKNAPLVQAKVQAEIFQLKGELLFRKGKTNEAVKQYRLTLNLRKKHLSPADPAIAQTIISLAGALKGVHLFSESEELYHQGFALYEKQVGSEHPYIATILNNLGQLYYLQGRYQESENVLKRALEIKHQFYHPDHISLAETYNHLGYLYYLLEQNTQSIQNFNRAISIWSKPDSSRPRYRANAQTWIAVSLHRQGKSQLALKKLFSALKVLREKYGDFSIATSETLHQIANIMFSLKRYSEAEKYYLNGITAASQFGSGDWLEEINLHSEIAKYYLEKQNHKQAIEHSRKAVEGLKLRIKRHSGLRAQSLTTELKSLKQVSLNHVDILYEQYKSNKNFDLLNETFEIAQISRSTSAARALAQMSQRFSTGSDALAKKIRAQHDLLEQWQDIDNILSAAFSQKTEQRNFEYEEQLRQFAQNIKTNIEKNELVIRNQFPEYDNLANSNTVSIKQVQDNLKPDEAMVVYLFGQEKSYLWLVKPTTANLYQLEINEEELDETVRALRQVLVPRYLAVEDMNLIPPLPVKRTYQLFKKILEPAYSSLNDINNLVVISDAALQSLPLSVLITQNPSSEIKTPEQHRNVQWLIKEKALSALPAVNSFILLRNIKRNNHSAMSSFIGFGDPSLVKTVEQIKLRSKNNLALRGATGVNNSLRGSESLRSILGNSRSSNAMDILAEMPELPETATELKQISSILKGNNKDVYLRDEATEQKLFEQTLSDYRVVQFATHGLMAGDFEGLFEPALVLTPSVSSYGISNNGILTASEITELNINADMVVLSACNTASSDGTPGAEGLSGLGKAFFYAGARTILVTHWEVLSDATVTLTTNMFTYSQENNFTKSKSHRLAVLDLIDNKDFSYYAHPMFWAPFMIIGAE